MPHSKCGAIGVWVQVPLSVPGLYAFYDTTTLNGGFEDFPSNYLKVININEIFSYLKILKKFDIIFIENK